MKCPGCGTKFDLDEARAGFNHYFAGSAEWDYDSDVSGQLCENCAEFDVCSRWMDGTLNAADCDPPAEYEEEWRDLQKKLRGLAD